MKKVRFSPYKALRKSAGLTQADVSNGLGYTSPQFVSNVERGLCRFPTKKLPKIAKMYRAPHHTIVAIEMAHERRKLEKVFGVGK